VLTVSVKRTIALATAALAVAALFAITRFGGSPMPQAVSAAEREAAAQTENLDTATFGSGCFWCTESNFDKVPGVVSTISGYMGGSTRNPTYEQVSSGRTGHVEALQVKYDPNKVTYKKLLDYYFLTTDVLDGGGQFCDRGNQYRPVIFTHTPEQKSMAEKMKSELDASGRFDKPVAVEIIEASEFTPAEEYHQNYYLKNPLRYKTYRWGCGRDRRLMELWGNAVTH
jgi:methionine-S-sulfoxide reductase